MKFHVDKYCDKKWYCVCVWHNPKFTGVTAGFRLAFCTPAQEESRSSVAVQKEKKINQNLGIIGKGEQNIMQLW